MNLSLKKENLPEKHEKHSATQYIRARPMRQIGVSELMVATSSYSVSYAKALFAATQSEMLVDPEKHKMVKGLSPEQVAKMEKEMEVLQRDLKVVEESHGNQVLNLVLARAHLANYSPTLVFHAIWINTIRIFFAS